jgi:hypothetical protein
MFYNNLFVNLDTNPLYKNGYLFLMNPLFMISLIAASLVVPSWIEGPEHKTRADNNAVDACNVINDMGELCEQNSERNMQNQQAMLNNNQTQEGSITVGFGNVGSYYGKGKVIIKNEDTGKILVERGLNFAKQHHNQGPDCCVKVYKFDANEARGGDDISAKVTAGGGSWVSGPFNYTKNLRISIVLDEIGE